jgi:hypothetical protein
MTKVRLGQAEAGNADIARAVAGDSAVVARYERYGVKP